MTLTDWPDRLLVIDIEGNGAVPPDLVEIAAFPILAGTPQPDQASSALLRPPHPISPYVTRIHGITNKNVTAAPTWETIADQVRADLNGVWIAAHNASVEYQVLTRHLPGWKPAGVIDTLRLARAVYKGARGHGLDALLDRAQVDLTGVPGKRHRAGYDAHATALLLLGMANHYPSWDALVAEAVPLGLPGAPAPAQEEQALW